MKSNSFIKIASLLIISSILFSCNFPKDPNNSWENINESGLDVGVVANSNANFEQELVKDFAKTNGLKMYVIEDNETALVKKLKAYQLHVVLGNFDKKSIWEKEVGMTSTYDGTHVLFIPKGENGLLFQLEKFIYNKK